MPRFKNKRVAGVFDPHRTSPCREITKKRRRGRTGIALTYSTLSLIQHGAPNTALCQSVDAADGTEALDVTRSHRNGLQQALNMSVQRNNELNPLFYTNRS